MRQRKIEAMHERFDVCTGAKCNDCSNFVRHRYNDKMLRKCSIYGLTHSEATDWAGKWEACGMFNREYSGKPIIHFLARTPRLAESAQIDGQMQMDEVAT